MAEDNWDVVQVVEEGDWDAGQLEEGRTVMVAAARER
jgi:hypothetical protein